MEAGYYAISTIGNKVSGASGAVEVQMSGIAKDDSSEPYTVFNEYVCYRVGAAVGLPLPPGTIAQTADGKNMYVSLRFTTGQTSLPPVEPAVLAADNPDVSAGIVAFDCWVGNWDRNGTNVAYVSGVSGVSIFDHGRTLLRTPDGTGLEGWRDKPLLHDNHVLHGHVDDLALLARWAQRIALVTSELIRDACGTAARLDTCTVAEAQAAGDFLEHRKSRIMDYMTAAQGMLPKVTGWKAAA